VTRGTNVYVALRPLLPSVRPGYYARTMRRSLAWLVTLPISLVGVELAHALVNAIIGSPTGSHGELFEAAGPAAGLTSGLTAAAIAIVLLALVANIAGAWPESDGGRVSPLPYALLAPTAFIVQEHVETFLHRGSLPLGTVLEPTFLPGLAVQLPFAVAAYLVARVLIRVAEVVRGRIGPCRPLPRPVVRALAPFSEGNAQPRAARLSSACSGRAPPARASARG
jgi:hypothetical protein